MKSPTKSNVLKPNCSKKPTFQITSVSPVSILSTGKSLSEALIFASTNPQYDDRLFIDLRLQYKENTSSEHVVYKNCFECQNKNRKQFLYTTCSELVYFLY